MVLIHKALWEGRILNSLEGEAGKGNKQEARTCVIVLEETYGNGRIEDGDDVGYRELIIINSTAVQSGTFHFNIIFHSTALLSLVHFVSYISSPYFRR